PFPFPIPHVRPIAERLVHPTQLNRVPHISHDQSLPTSLFEHVVRPVPAIAEPATRAALHKPRPNPHLPHEPVFLIPDVRQTTPEHHHSFHGGTHDTILPVEVGWAPPATELPGPARAGG